MDRRKTSDLIWYALQCAKSDRQALADAYGNDTNEFAVKQAHKDIKAFTRLQMKLFGTSRSKLDAEMDKMKPVSFSELRKIFEAESNE
jgi:hypothetical protein